MTQNTMTYAEKSKNYWTDEKLKKLIGDKSYLITPRNGSQLLRSLGIMNQDCSISHDSARKFIQINHMINMLEIHLKDLITRFSIVRILDTGCGKSYLTFLLAWYFKEKANHPCEIYGVDTNTKLIESSNQKAKELGYTSLKFIVSSLSSFNWKEMMKSEEAQMRPHALFALHACDIATDMALAIGIKEKSDFIAVVPCCQAELARKWKNGLENSKANPLHPIFATPHMRREVGAQFTDMMRILLTRAHGYEVTATEFVPSEHTPKNRLIFGVRRGNYLQSAQVEYEAMKNEVGGHSIALEEFLSN